MSVIIESELGEATGFREKKDVNLLPGVVGFLLSMTVRDLLEEDESVRKGGGLEPGLRTMSSSTATSSKDRPLGPRVLYFATGEVVILPG